MSGDRGSLVLDGDLDLMDPLPQGGSFHIVGLAGLEFGNSEPSMRTVPSFLTDGEIVEADKFGNVEFAVPVRIEGSSGAALAEAEAMLEARLGKRTTLAWTPPSVFGVPTSVFEILESWSESSFDDLAEAKGRPHRSFVLRMVRRPWVRSVDRVTIEAQGFATDPVDPVEVVLSDGSTTSGWAGVMAGATVVSEGGKVINATTTLPKKSTTANLQLTYTLPVPLDFVAAGTPLVAFDWFRDGGYTIGTPVVTVTVDGEPVDVDQFAAVASPLGGGYSRYWYMVPAGVVSAVKMQVYVRGTGYVPRRLLIDQVTRMSHVPAIGLGGQQFRTITVPGTAPTEVSIQVSHETDALGDVFIWTGRVGGGYQPPCSPWRTAGDAPLPTTGTVSGGWGALDGGTPQTYDIPIDAIPRGTYAMLAILKGTAPGNQLVEWNVSTLVGATEHAPSHGFASRSLTITAAIYDLGTLSLPTMPAGADAFVRLELYSAGAAQVDEVWLANVTDGQMSLISCGTGTPATGGASNRLWIDAPSVEDPQPRYYLGTDADRSDQRGAAGDEIRAMMIHELLPGDNNIFTATTGVTKAAASADLDVHWTHNAGS